MQRDKMTDQLTAPGLCHQPRLVSAQLHMGRRATEAGVEAMRGPTSLDFHLPKVF